MSDKSLCVGCRDNYYNGNNERGIAECWHRKTAKEVTRWRIGWWTVPTAPGAFQEVITHDCHSAPGDYALAVELPPFASEPIRLTHSAISGSEGETNRGKEGTDRG
jgi:hypothetical protein